MEIFAQMRVRSQWEIAVAAVLHCVWPHHNPQRGCSLHEISSWRKISCHGRQRVFLGTEESTLMSLKTRWGVLGWKYKAVTVQFHLQFRSTAWFLTAKLSHNITRLSLFPVPWIDLKTWLLSLILSKCSHKWAESYEVVVSNVCWAFFSQV